MRDAMLRTKRSLIVVLLLAAVASGANPATELSVAAHLASRYPEHAPRWRFISLYHVPPADLAKAKAAVSLAVNYVSHSRDIVRPRVAGLSDTLLVIDLAHYTTTNEERQSWIDAWDRMAEDDPYWHLKTELLDPETGNRKTAIVDGGWVGTDNATRLRQTTGSLGAILRGDYVVAKFLTTLEGGQYYQLTLTDENEGRWFEDNGVDTAVSRQLRAWIGASMAKSDVTFKPRRVIRYQGVLGGIYATYDSIETKAENDPVRYPIGSPGGKGGLYLLDHDAVESIAVAPNGLLRFALFNGQRQRQDVVPDAVAKDHLGLDGRLQPGISCIRCHTESGLRPVRDDVSGLLEANVDLLSSDPDTARTIREFYDTPKFNRHLVFDQETVEAAAGEATGMKEFGEALDALVGQYEAYTEHDVDLDMAIRELGCEKAHVEAAIKQTRDPLLMMMLAGRSILRDQWEDSFPELATACAAAARGKK